MTRHQIKSIAFTACFNACLFVRADDAHLSQGASAQIDGQKIMVKRIDALPYVEDQYTKRFHFDSVDNSKLKQLRERYHLDQVVAPGKDEFDKQVILMDWVHKRFRKFGRPSTAARGGLEILRGIEEGHSFFCAQYAQLMVSSAASLGWVDRELALRRHQGVNAHGGSTEHSTTEIWSNQYRKWVMLDPTSDMYLEKDGIPLNGWEIRQEWFYNSGKDLVFVIGNERRKYRKSDLPISLERFAEFGDLTVDPDELDKYGFIGYIPNTNLMDAGEDYGQMFITKDALCDGTRWHVRPLPEHPATDPYFPIDQAAIELNRKGAGIGVSLKTLTPNFQRYETRLDGGTWKPSEASFEWKLHPGNNRLEVRSVNAFGISGPVASAEIQAGP